MKKLNANGDEFLMDGDFEFYCLQLINPVGILKILVFFPVGLLRVPCSFAAGDELQGIFLTGDEFFVDFSGG